MTANPARKAVSRASPTHSLSWRMIAFLATGFLAASDRSYGATIQGDAQSLDKLVHSFFLEDHPGKRDALRSLVEQASNRSFEAVVESVRNVDTWPEVTQQNGLFNVELPSGQTVSVLYALPSGYDPIHAYPLLICVLPRFPSPLGPSPFEDVTRLLGPQADEFVVVCVLQPTETQYFETVDTGTDFSSFLVELRHMFHLDVNRTFFFIGHDHAKTPAWLLAAKHPSEFAGIICDDPHSPIGMFANGESLFYLENLGSTPWLCHNRFKGGTAADFTFGDFHSIVREGRKVSLADSLGSLNATRISVEDFVTRNRQTPLRRISFWFRYPEQGSIGWLAQTRFSGPVWEEEQLSVRPARGVSYDEFLDDTLKSLLAYLGAEVNGQTIDIQTRKCAAIAVLLPIDLVDLSQPVTIRINGKRRYHEKIKPNIRVLLDTAYKRWDFQNLTAAQRSFSVRSDSQKP